MLKVRLSDDLDYRILYLDEEFFSEKMQEVYTGLSTHNRPPEFFRVFNEMLEYVAYFFLIKEKDLFPNLSEDDINGLAYELMNKDEMALGFVYDKIPDDFFQLFARDLQTYMVEEGLFFIEGEVVGGSYVDASHVKIVYNSPFDVIW